MITFKPIAPTVHLNGTSYDELYDRWRAAEAAVLAAVDALNNLPPHGRDYYPQDADQASQGATYRLARDQHLARVTKLLGVHNELLSILNQIIDQHPGK